MSLILSRRRRLFLAGGLQPIMLPYTMRSDDILYWISAYYGDGEAPQKVTNGLSITGPIYIHIPNEEKITGNNNSQKIDPALANWKSITIRVRRDDLSDADYVIFTIFTGTLSTLQTGSCYFNADESNLNFTVERSLLGNYASGKSLIVYLSPPSNGGVTVGQFVLESITLT